MNELLKSIAAGTIVFEEYEESNQTDLYLNCEDAIDLYCSLVSGDKTAIKRCTHAIEVSEEYGDYFDEDDMTAFLDRYSTEFN